MESSRLMKVGIEGFMAYEMKTLRLLDYNLEVSLYEFSKHCVSAVVFLSNM